ncbi:MAG: lysophospholipid acyltransferase family protein [Planctomycetes bacterium]|nr:lysophospholipid acyltransferase family protein [Planctomycetota bacterium]
MSIAADPVLPHQSLWMFRLFRWHCGRYARKHFHAVRFSRSSPAIPALQGRPLIFVMNHPSWWDIIAGVVLTNRFVEFRHFAPIDADMLPKYRFFSRIGFFGIDSTPRGAARFLRTTKAIFEQPHRALWITAQGKFVDPRVRPIELRPGIGYVASRLQKGLIVPVAVEYPFWQERTPEMLLRYGEPLDLADGSHRDGREWTAAIESALTVAQDALAAEAIQRDPAAFEVLVSGKVGVGGVYDGWRRFKAWIRGRRFDAGHAPPPIDVKTEGSRA